MKPTTGSSRRLPPWQRTHDHQRHRTNYDDTLSSHHRRKQTGTPHKQTGIMLEHSTLDTRHSTNDQRQQRTKQQKNTTPACSYVAAPRDPTTANQRARLMPLTLRKKIHRYYTDKSDRLWTGYFGRSDVRNSRSTKSPLQSPISTPYHNFITRTCLINLIKYLLSGSHTRMCTVRSQLLFIYPNHGQLFFWVYIYNLNKINHDQLFCSLSFIFNNNLYICLINNI